jgi:ribosomal protein S18 acetylase RimI-like enzyme
VKYKIVTDLDSGKINIFIRQIFRYKYLGYANYILDDSNRIHLADIKVYRERKGYGSLLLEELIRITKDFKVECIYGNVMPPTESNFNFYKKNGFQIDNGIVVDNLFSFDHTYQCFMLIDYQSN